MNILFKNVYQEDLYKNTLWVQSVQETVMNIGHNQELEIEIQRYVRIIKKRKVSNEKIMYYNTQC